MNPGETMSSYQTSHLPADRLENFIDGLSGPEPSAMERDHVAMCSRCRRELRQLKQMHALLAELPELVPSPGFQAAVMSRVDLPASEASVDSRWPVPVWTFLASLVLVFPTAGGLYWGLHQAGWLDQLAGQALERAGQWGWTMLMGAGQWFWETGLPQQIAGLAGSIQPLELAGLGAGVFGLASLSVFVIYRLAALPPPTAVLEHAG